jgi:hypothetical protein
MSLLTDVAVTVGLTLITPALGERTNTAPVLQPQLAATEAALLGENYDAAVPRAGRSIDDVIAALAAFAPTRVTPGEEMTAPAEMCELS